MSIIFLIFAINQNMNFVEQVIDTMAIGDASISSMIERYIPDYDTMPIRVLLGIMKNQNAFRRLTINYNIFKYYYNYSKVSAIFTAENILIYLPEFHLYQLFDDIERYKMYMNSIGRDCFYNGPIEYIAYQLVLINSEHNFLLKCENNVALIEKICKIFEKHKVVKTVDGLWIQLVFNSHVKGFVQEQNLLQSVYSRVPNESIHIPRHNSIDNKFIENRIPNIPEDVTCEKYMKIIKRSIMKSDLYRRYV